MLSLRVVARSAPRTLSRLGSTAVRQSTAARSSSLLKSSWAPIRTSQLTSAFSTTPLRSKQAGEVDAELSSKLESELQFETEMREEDDTPATIKDFLENSPFELKDIPGQEDVYLTRKFGNETITVSFSINDLANFEPDTQLDEEDSALTDEEMNTPEGRELAEAEAEEGNEEDMDDPRDHAVPCRLNIVVEKPGKGALNIEALAQEGSIVVDNFYYFKDPKLAHSSSAEATHAAQDVYPGPPFGSLDEDLQLILERYLEERGVTQALAVFVPDYMDLKEQKEYLAWLKDVKGFIDA